MGAVAGDGRGLSWRRCRLLPTVSCSAYTSRPRSAPAHPVRK